MPTRTCLITGVSSGFGRELTTQLLDRGDRLVGTVRRPEAVADLTERYPDTLRAELLDVTDTAAIHDVVDRSFAELGRIDVIVGNAATASSAPPRTSPTSRSTPSTTRLPPTAL